MTTDFNHSMLHFFLKKWEKYHIPLLAALVAGFLAHFMAFTNKLTNHDDVFNLFSKGASASSGRWGLDILSFVLPDFSMPWIYGVITLILIASAGCVMLRVLDIHNKILQILLMALLVTYPSLTSVYTYMFTSSSYGVAFFLSVLSVYQWVFQASYKKLFAFPMLIFSLSVYQPYLTVAASLFMICLVKQILNKDTSSRSIWLQGLSYFAFLMISLILYYSSIYAVFSLFQIQFNSYASENLLLDINTLLQRLIDTYYTFIYFFTRGYHGILNTSLMRILHLFLIILGVILLVLRFHRHPSISKALLLSLCIALFPLSINCIYLIANPNSIHTLVVYSFVNIYFLIALVLDDCSTEFTYAKTKLLEYFLPKLCRQIAIPCLLAVIISNVYLANEVYLKVQLSYENTYAFYSVLCSEIVNHPDFDRNTKVAIIGSITDNPIVDPVSDYDEFESVSIMGSDGIGIHSYSRQDFVRFYLGFNILFAEEEQIKEIKQTSSFATMSSYPYYGSIQKIDNFLVVKLSDPEL
ncbi:MAG: glucosyltransferase domain-containing protein [Oscillospiraceae bacterium]|nr:glucosyltransferase domain-containing protein [Oscillospiraceae bacterium]